LGRSYIITAVSREVKVKPSTCIAPCMVQGLDARCPCYRTSYLQDFEAAPVKKYITGWDIGHALKFIQTVCPSLPYSFYAGRGWKFVKFRLNFRPQSRLTQPWTFAVYRLWRDETMYQIWTQSSNLRWIYCDLNIWPNDLEHCVTCCARLRNNFHRVWPSTTYPCLSYSIFMLIGYVILWPLPLTRWPWKFVVHIKHNVVEISTKIERNRAIRG